MSNEKSLVKSLERSLQAKTLGDLVRAKTSEVVYLVADVSSSMHDTFLDKDGRTARKIDALRRVVAMIQNKTPTPMIIFGGPWYPEGFTFGGDQQLIYAKFADEVPEPFGGTPLAEAIQFARDNGAGRLVVISDGGPNDQSRAMETAAVFGGRIDVVYIGMPGDYGSKILIELAEKSGGTQFEGDLTEPLALAGSVIGLLNGEVLQVSEDEEEDADEDDEEDEDDEDQ